MLSHLSKLLLITLTTIFVGSFLFVLNPQTVNAEEWLTGWSYRKKITIDQSNVDADLTDFPLLVKITNDSNLSTALANGYDIRFTSQDGATLLKYERESWSGGNSLPVTAVIWVKVPNISATTNTDIYMYYGKADATDGQDASNVWDSNFKGVWHLNDPTNPLDATSNNNDGTNYGGTSTTGKIAGGVAFDNSSFPTLASNFYHTDFGSSTSFNSSDYSISIWFKKTTANAGGAIFARANGLFSGSQFALFLGSASVRFDFPWVKTILNYFSVPAAENINWHLFTYTRSGNIHTYFFDGSIVTTVVDATAPGYNGNVWIGGGNFGLGAYSHFTGSLDEPRISTTARTAEWIKFEYNNMNESDNELAISSEQDTTPPTISSFSPTSGSTVTSSTPTITFTTNENATCRISRNVDESYQDMADNITCEGSGTTSQSCTTPDLGTDEGTKTETVHKSVSSECIIF
jgi:hypothetical protein